MILFSFISRFKVWLFNIFNSTSEKHFGYKSLISICFLLIGHRHFRRILLPVTFSVKDHLKNYPPLQYGFQSTLKFNEGKLYYFLSLLSSIPARNKDLINEEGWVPIHMGLVKNSIKDIIWYKNYLIETGILECDHTYIPGTKSYGYRWSSPYREADFELKEVVCPHEDTAYFANEIDDVALQQTPYLSYWYNCKQLTVDPQALQYASAVCRAKIQGNMTWDNNSNTGKKKHPKIQYEASLVNLDKLQQHRYEVHIDSNVHRLHSVITNIQSDLRNFLTYDGKELVDIDIKNCQPYLACAFLNPLFWKKENGLSLSLYSLPDNIQSALLQQEVITEIEDFFSKHQAVDFQPYINKVASGKFYEEFAALSTTKLQKPITRKEAKTLMFYILFSSNQGQHSDPLIQQMKKIFSQEIYPEVADLFKIIKRSHRSIPASKQHNRLARLLQNIESEIILRRCCKRIWDEGKQQVPIFTIHDCIATIPPHKDLVEKIMQEELTQAIGVSPSLGVETWGIAAVKHPELLN